MLLEEFVKRWLERGAGVELRGPKLTGAGFAVIVQAEDLRLYGDGESLEEAAAVAERELPKRYIAPGT